MRAHFDDINLPQTIVEHLAQNNILIIAASLVSGGDINEARKIITSDQKDYFLKFNQTKNGSQLLSSEIAGLELLRKNNIPTPTIIQSNLSKGLPYLLLEWIATVQRNDLQLAKSLSKLHQVSNNQFGLDQSNYIGALPQSNLWMTDFYEFYITQRIEPQLRMARDKGFDYRLKLEQLETILRNTIPNEKPALIHGDLWAGNMMDGQTGPVFIDPSISYCHREMDLAMMLLFGGYDKAVFVHYHELFPLEKNWRKRKDLFQLYYLLVHLNLFGTSYYDAVKDIFKQYLS